MEPHQPAEHVAHEEVIGGISHKGRVHGAGLAQGHDEGFVMAHPVYLGRKCPEARQHSFKSPFPGRQVLQCGGEHHPVGERGARRNLYPVQHNAVIPRMGDVSPRCGGIVFQGERPKQFRLGLQPFRNLLLYK